MMLVSIHRHFNGVNFVNFYEIQALINEEVISSIKVDSVLFSIGRDLVFIQLRYL